MRGCIVAAQVSTNIASCPSNAILTQSFTRPQIRELEGGIRRAHQDLAAANMRADVRLMCFSDAAQGPN